jgi:hypothetical protein
MSRRVYVETPTLTVLTCTLVAHCLAHVPYRLDTLNTEMAELQECVREANVDMREATE